MIHYSGFLHAWPQVPYGTALDVFIIICFALVFLSFVEFAFINFLDIYVRFILFIWTKGYLG